MRIEIYDTTLRDGAQSPGVTFTLRDKLRVIASLDEFGADYIEAGNPSSNQKDMELFAEAAKLPLQHSKLVAFGATRRPGGKACEDGALRGLIDACTPAVAIFGKSWLMHVTSVLGTSAEENLAMIDDTVRFLKGEGREVIFDAEHFFDGYKDDPEYAMSVLRSAKNAGADVLCLCDTNGGCLPGEIKSVVERVVREIAGRVSIHCHNDSGLAEASSVEAVLCGATQVQGTVLGLGERCGNANLSVLIPTLFFKCGAQFNRVDTEKLREIYSLSRNIAELANIAVNESMPYVGSYAFTHKAGMHIDAVNKTSASFEHISPESVGNVRNTLVSEVAGRAALLNKMKQILPEVTKDSPVTIQTMEMVKSRENEGYQYENADGSLALLILAAAGKRKSFYELKTYKLVLTEPDGSQSEPLSAALIKISVGDGEEITAAEGDGPVNALDKALRKALLRFYPAIDRTRLIDYKVRVLNSSDATGAKVRVIIETTDGQTVWRTVGVSSDIIQASWIALCDSIEYALSRDDGLL